jgi:hypothetical protein
MTPLLPFLFCLGVPLLFAAAKYMKDLEIHLVGWILAPMAAGGIAGAVFVAARDVRPALRIPLLVALLSIAALWLFRREHAPDAFEGLLRGGLLASGFGIPLAIRAERPFVTLSIALAVALAACAIASWMSDAASRTATMAFVVASAAVAAAAAASAGGLVEPVTLAFALALAAGLAAAASPFLLFPGVAEELEDESALGVLPEALVHRVSHPLQRFSRGTMEREAHRRIIQVAWRLAVRRRQQRSVGLEESRLHQIEILKLRQELGQLLRANDEIEVAGEAAAARIQSSPKGTPTE